jgi:hypothetical protein
LNPALQRASSAWAAPTDDPRQAGARRGAVIGILADRLLDTEASPNTAASCRLADRRHQSGHSDGGAAPGSAADVQYLGGNRYRLVFEPL